jgi:quercetin 2,3-dioxygenase
MERKITEIIQGHATTDGDGVSLKRILSHPQVKLVDPFLMLDSFGSEDTTPGPGFPWHPHRGIVTISYMIKGSMHHEDSLGNNGMITTGGVQWMKAASGIIHQEMPKPGPTGISGFQFWLNLPATEKMSDPDYGDILSETFPVVTPHEGVQVKVIAGEFEGVQGLVHFKITEPEFYEITLQKDACVTIPTPEKKNFFAVGIEGNASVDGVRIPNKEASLLSEGDSVVITAQEDTRLLLVGGNRLEEPIAWNGPIVMNTQKELSLAFDELNSNSFVKKRSVR